MLDREKLTKLLAMTTSDTEPEALAAIRMANAMLKRENMTWGQVLAPVNNVTITLHRQAPTEAYQATEEWTAPHLKDGVMIDTMFRAIYAQPRTGNEGFWEWLDDVHHKFEEYGRLTPGQYTALAKCYRRTLRTGT